VFDYAASDVAQLVGGCLERGDGGARMTHAVIDSRKARPGALFFALPGERSDGHDHVLGAARAGACGAVVSRPLADSDVASLGDTFALIRVPHTLAALSALAAHHRRTMPARVVGVTGSAGKTTTKDMIAAVLGAGKSVLATEGNMNNEIGLPLTLLKLEIGHEVAVAEMAMRAIGEISALAAVARPDVGVVINVGPAHIGELGSIENIAAAKAELVQALPPDGVAVLNGDDPRVKAMAAQAGCRVVLFGLDPGCDVRATDVSESADSTCFHLLIEGKRAGQMKYRVPVPGMHNVMNALAALAVGHSLGLSFDEMWGGLGRFAPSAMRMHFIDMADGVTIVDDSYNANPVSMRCAIDAVLQSAAGRPVVAVLGDMLELGAESASYHRDVGRYAARRGISALVAMGPMAGQVASGAIDAGMQSASVASCLEPAEAAALAEAMAKPGSVILVKGSRGMQMERVVEALSTCGS
jgi:UDP-N-acetylmuramoyl-tripeptide--D-alanyl-D-alanine ligase